MKLPLFLFSLMCVFTLAAQTPNNNSLVKGESKVLFEDDQLVIQAKKGDCIIEQEGLFNEVVYLSVTNKTEKILTTTFRKETYYNQNCTGCKSTDKEYEVSLALNAKESISGLCELGVTPLLVFSKFLNRTNNVVLTDLKVVNVKIEEVKK